MNLFDTGRPYIASYVVFRRGDEVAFVLRQNTDYMDGYYGLIAGKVEKDETFTQAAVREAKEEAGVTIQAKDLHVALVAHRHSSGSDWVDVLFEVDTWEGEPFNAEPHMHSKLEWLDTKNLPENVIPAVRFFLEQIAAGQTYAEYGWETTS